MNPGSIRNIPLKRAFIAWLRLLYMKFPMPHALKRRIKDFVTGRVSLAARVESAVRNQVVEQNVSVEEGATPPGGDTNRTISESNSARESTRSSSANRSIGYVDASPDSGLGFTPNVRLMAFYLPQFHPIPENDLWWGKGFTEWSNVSRALPQVEGQCQPHLPGELGFYDLRTEGVMERQVQLARDHGIEGFCFYFYWFGGKRLLERPLLDFLKDDRIDFSFSLCWANENWTRRWDGHDQDVLMGQNHSPEDDLAFIEHVAQYMRDPRYVRIEGRPLLTVYRPSLLPNAAKTAELWRARCRELGLGEIYLAFTLAFDSFTPSKIGFDGAVEFPPNNTFPPDITSKVRKLNPEFEGSVYDWRCYVERSKNYARPKHDLFRGVCPSWDNEARKSARGTLLLHSSPRGYSDWLVNAAKDTVDRYDSRDKRLVFVNAWNEWAEGAHLEPDVKFGYAYLDATKRALKWAAAPSQATKPARIVVVIHAFYTELLADIVDRLNAWTVSHRVVVTTSPGKETEVRAALSGLREPYECFVWENRGRDVLPFLRLAGRLLDMGETIVLKLHTKKSLHRVDGDIWRNDLLDKLTLVDNVSEIMKAFEEQPQLNLVAPDGHILSMDTYWGSNADTVEYLCRRMDISPPTIESAAFPAGSMFYVRLAALRPLLDAHLNESEFEAELGQVDGTMAHAVERIFGIVAELSNGFLASTNTPGSRFLTGAKEYAYAAASKN
jgi:lipopolysaccharide biosynthesis protein